MLGGKVYGVAIARFVAGTAMDAECIDKSNLGPWFERLRVLAPCTPQWAAFEEDNSAYARAVVEGKALDVDDQPSYILCGSHRHDVRVLLQYCDEASLGFSRPCVQIVMPLMPCSDGLPFAPLERKLA